MTEAGRDLLGPTAPGSFRDPAGHVHLADDHVLRTVSQGFAPVFAAVAATGVHEALRSAGLLVDFEVATDVTPPDGVDAVLRSPRLPFVSHPYEWSPGQLRAAALHTLRVAEVCLDHGVVLRDASAYNVQFVGTRPVFIDLLSFAPRTTDEPWPAYGQFCRHFLAPLALQTLVDPRLCDLLRTNIDGVPLDLASSLLPTRTRLRPGLLTHVHAHASASGRGRADADGARRRASMSDLALRGVLDSLRKTVEGLTWDGTGTVWADYYADADHYGDESLAEKEAAVRRLAAAVEPATAMDMGANTGRFSRVVAGLGARVLALDVDHGAVERGFASLVADPTPAGWVLPLRYDLVNPSPALGWATGERQSLEQRGPVDLVLGLALVHHLAIGNNVPLDEVVDHLASFGHHLLLEWVPPDDPMVRVLMATRDREYPDYTHDRLRASLARRGDVLDEVAVPGTDRCLHLLRCA